MRRTEYGSDRSENGGQIDYARALDMYDKKYAHIPKRLNIEDSNFLEYINYEFRHEMEGSYIIASSFTTDGYPTRLIMYLKNGTEVGYFTFCFPSFFRNERENKDPAIMLGSDRAQINENFRGRGVSNLFHAIIFQYYPNLYGVRCRLGLDNATAYKTAADEGQDEFEAFKATPAYKTFSRFGFSAIDRNRSLPSNGTLVMTREPNNQ